MPRVWADTTPGRITELLANEQDPVTVGQNLFCFEPGTVDKSASKEKAPGKASWRFHARTSMSVDSGSHAARLWYPRYEFCHHRVAAGLRAHHRERAETRWQRARERWHSPRAYPPGHRSSLKVHVVSTEMLTRRYSSAAEERQRRSWGAQLTCSPSKAPTSAPR